MKPKLKSFNAFSGKHYPLNEFEFFGVIKSELAEGQNRSVISSSN